jgi:hypothetical protein
LSDLVSSHQASLSLRPPANGFFVRETRPDGMAMDGKGFIHVVDLSNQRVQKFAP